VLGEVFIETLPIRLFAKGSFALADAIDFVENFLLKSVECMRTELWFGLIQVENVRIIAVDRCITMNGYPSFQCFLLFFELLGHCLVLLLFIAGL
jgi:hypothetical protein